MKAAAPAHVAPRGGLRGPVRAARFVRVVDARDPGAAARRAPRGAAAAAAGGAGAAWRARARGGREASSGVLGATGSSPRCSARRLARLGAGPRFFAASNRPRARGARECGQAPRRPRAAPAGGGGASRRGLPQFWPRSARCARASCSGSGPRGFGVVQRARPCPSRRVAATARRRRGARASACAPSARPRALRVDDDGGDAAAGVAAAGGGGGGATRGAAGRRRVLVYVGACAWSGRRAVRDARALLELRPARRRRRVLRRAAAALGLAPRLCARARAVRRAAPRRDGRRRRLARGRAARRREPAPRRRVLDRARGRRG